MVAVLYWVQQHITSMKWQGKPTPLPQAGGKIGVGPEVLSSEGRIGVLLKESSSSRLPSIWINNFLEILSFWLWPCVGMPTKERSCNVEARTWYRKDIDILQCLLDLQNIILISYRRYNNGRTLDIRKEARRGRKPKMTQLKLLFLRPWFCKLQKGTSDTYE